MISDKKNMFFSSLLTSVSKSKKWLYDTWKENETGIGWSLTEDNYYVMPWGGTLDAIRALIYAGESIHSPIIAKSLKWLLNSQNEDGGWSSWEIKKSCVDVTCWIVITLKMINDQTYIELLNKAYIYLLNNQKEDGSFGAYYNGESRIYATLLAIWALYDVHPIECSKATKWLLDSKNSDGAWGFKYKDKNSNVVITSMIAIVLHKSSQLNDQEMIDNIIEFIYDSMLSDYTWESLSEPYIAYEDCKDKEQIFTVCNHNSSMWAIMALIRLDGTIQNTILIKAVNKLIEMQNEDGSWYYNKFDKKKYTWCVANAIWVLVDIEKMLSNSLMYVEMYLKQVEKERKNRLTQIILTICVSVNFLLTLLMFIFHFNIHLFLIEKINVIYDDVKNLILSNCQSFILPLSITIIGGVFVGVVLHYLFTKK